MGLLVDAGVSKLGASTRSGRLVSAGGASIRPVEDSVYSEGRGLYQRDENPL